MRLDEIIKGVSEDREEKIKDWALGSSMLSVWKRGSPANDTEQE